MNREKLKTYRKRFNTTFKNYLARVYIMVLGYKISKSSP